MKTLPASLQEYFELGLQLEVGYQLSEGVNLARDASVMTRKAEDINKTKDMC